MNIKPITPNTATKINKQMPKFVQYLNGYKTRMGERQDIFINAIGTGIVAPLFIKHNKLSETDEKTKTYSALRQTAMAIIAIITQAGITIPIDKYINNLIKKEALGKKFTQSQPANIQAFKRVSNLLVAFATIPLSCTILNKTYPIILLILDIFILLFGR